MTREEEKETDDVSGPAQPSEPVDEDESSPALEPEGPDPDAVTEPPAEVADLAAACVRFTTARYGVAPDFTPDTLSLVDQWLKDARQATEAAANAGRVPVAIESRPSGRGAMAEHRETLELVQAAAGAYLGEVVRRAFGARWRTGSDYSAWRLCMSSVYMAFNPLGMTREALTLETTEGWHAHFELDPAERDTIEARLDALPQVTDEEYYAPSTRFDVIHMVFDALRERMRTSALADVRFTLEDYEGEGA